MNSFLSNILRFEKSDIFWMKRNHFSDFEVKKVRSMISSTRKSGVKNLAVAGIGLKKYSKAAPRQLSLSGWTTSRQEKFAQASLKHLLKTLIFKNRNLNSRSLKVSHFWMDRNEPIGANCKEILQCNSIGGSLIIIL